MYKRQAVARLFGDAICTAAHAGELVFALGDALELGEANRALAGMQAGLGVEEYGITQPTMEAVFMKAVSVLEDATEADDTRGVEVLGDGLEAGDDVGHQAVPVAVQHADGHDRGGGRDASLGAGGERRDRRAVAEAVVRSGRNGNVRSGEGVVRGVAA